MINQVVVIDSQRYVSRDPFQAQLHHAIQNSMPNDFEYLSLLPGRTELTSRVRNLHCISKLSSETRFVLISRQRILFRKMNELQRIIGDREVVIYEQDPWESYILGSKSYGFFEFVSERLNLKKVVVTSLFWRDILRQRLSCQVEFARMGIDSRFIPYRTIPFHERQGKVEFKGTLKDHRKKAFERMRSFGVDIKILPPNLDYKSFLIYLRNLRIFVHDESGFYSCPEIMNGKVPRGAGLWAKEIECASQGTFVIRNAHEDSISYGLEKLPLVKLYQEPEDVVDIVDEILSLKSIDIEEIQEASKSELIQRNDWFELARRLMR